MTSVLGKNLQNGKYVLNEELGEGGFGRTYKAINQVLNQVVVIKTFKSDLAQQIDPCNSRQEFLHEAQRLIKCYHPNIVRFYEFFSEDGVPYIVMDYIPGKTLDRIVLPNNPLSEATAIAYIRQVGEALKVVHNNGLLHRDVKPHNLILREDNQQVVLIDFGIAREFSSGAIQTHTSLVSDGYAPIEQYLPKAERTPASDIYALAATLYTLVMGEIPISATLRNRIPLDPPKDIRPELSNQISEAIMQGIALEAEERPRSVQEWLSLLPESDHNNVPESVKRVSLIKTKNTSANLPTVAQKIKSSYKGRILPGLIVFAALVSGLDYVWLKFQPSSQNEKTDLNNLEKLTPSNSLLIPDEKSQPLTPEINEINEINVNYNNTDTTTPSTPVSSPSEVTLETNKNFTTDTTKPSTPVSSPSEVTPEPNRKANYKRRPSIFVSPEQKVTPKTNNSSERVPDIFVSPFNSQQKYNDEYDDYDEYDEYDDYDDYDED